MKRSKAVARPRALMFRSLWSSEGDGGVGAKWKKGALGLIFGDWGAHWSAIIVLCQYLHVTFSLGTTRKSNQWMSLSFIVVLFCQGLCVDYQFKHFNVSLCLQTLWASFPLGMPELSITPKQRQLRSSTNITFVSPDSSSWFDYRGTALTNSCDMTWK